MTIKLKTRIQTLLTAKGYACTVEGDHIRAIKSGVVQYVFSYVSALNLIK